MGIEATTIFRVIIIEEVHNYTNPATYKEEILTIYVGQVLEWDVCAQGNTITEVMDNVEALLVGQKFLNDTKKYKIVPAPEEWQRVRNSGARMRHVRKEYIEAFGIESYLIVDRRDIDISKSRYVVKGN
jgi:predicted RNase H-like HicB family nuclease